MSDTSLLLASRARQMEGDIFKVGLSPILALLAWFDEHVSVC